MEVKLEKQTTTRCENALKQSLYQTLSLIIKRNLNKRNYVLILIMSINLLSFSQENTITVKSKNDDSVKFRLFIPTISLIGNYPLIHSNEHSGIIDFNFQLNLTNNTKIKRWVFGTNLNYFVFKNQNLNNSNLFKISLNIEYDFREIGPLLGLKFAGDIGYYNEKLKNGLSYGFGLVFDRMIFDKTQLLINLKENILVGHFNYLNLGVGLRRFI